MIVQFGVPSFPMFAVPVGAVAIVVTLLLHIRLALLINVVLAIVAGILVARHLKTTDDL